MAQTNNSATVQDIRDVKSVVYPRDYTWLVLAGIIIFVLAAYVFRRFFKNRRYPVQKEVLPSKTPWEIAIERLERLRNENLIAQGEVKKYYTVLGDILRVYFEDRFLVKAPEMTTQEFLEHLSKLPHLNLAQKETFKDFLNFCDMVKFAKYVPDAGHAAQSFEMARRLIEETQLT